VKDFQGLKRWKRGNSNAISIRLGKAIKWYVKRKLGSAFFIWHKAACRKGCIYLPEHAVLEVTLTRNLLNIRPARLSHWNILTRHPASTIENLCSETFFNIFSSTFFFLTSPRRHLEFRPKHFWSLQHGADVGWKFTNFQELQSRVKLDECDINDFRWWCFSTMVKFTKYLSKFCIYILLQYIGCSLFKNLKCVFFN